MKRVYGKERQGPATLRRFMSHNDLHLYLKKRWIRCRNQRDKTCQLLQCGRLIILVHPFTINLSGFMSNPGPDSQPWLPAPDRNKSSKLHDWSAERPKPLGNLPVAILELHCAIPIVESGFEP